MVACGAFRGQAEQAFDEGLVGQHVAAGAFVDDAAVVDDDAALRVRQRQVVLLLDEQDAHAAGAAHAIDRGQHLLHDQRREPFHGFVQQQHLRVRHQRPADAPASAARRPRAGRRSCPAARAGGGTARRRARSSTSPGRARPRARFSSTVSEGNTSRSCGTQAMPERLRACAWQRARSACRAAGSCRNGDVVSPMMVSTSVVLPTPLRPITTSVSPACSVQRRGRAARAQAP